MYFQEIVDNVTPVGSTFNKSTVSPHMIEALHGEESKVQEILVPSISAEDTTVDEVSKPKSAYAWFQDSIAAGKLINLPVVSA